MDEFPDRDGGENSIESVERRSIAGRGRRRSDRNDDETKFGKGSASSGAKKARAERRRRREERTAGASALHFRRIDRRPALYARRKIQYGERALLAWNQRVGRQPNKRTNSRKNERVNAEASARMHEEAERTNERAIYPVVVVVGFFRRRNAGREFPEAACKPSWPTERDRRFRALGINIRRRRVARHRKKPS